MASRHGSRRKHKNKNLKKNILYVAGGILGVLLILVALTVTGRGDADRICRTLGFNGANLFGDACSVNNKYAFDNVVIVTGNTQNSPKPIVTSEIKKILVNSIMINDGAKVSVYSVSGSNNRISSSNLYLDEYDDINDFSTKILKLVNKVSSQIATEPDSNGAAYTEGIIQGIKQLKDTGGALIIIGSGLSDSGVLNFANNNILDTDVKNILSEIEKSDELPQIETEKEISILWTGLGRNVPPQASIGEANIEKLKQIYEGVFEKVIDGKKKILTMDDYLSGSSSINTNYTVKTTGARVKSIYEVTFSSDSSVSFYGDKAVFQHSDEEIFNELSGVKTTADNNPNSKIYIDGFVAAVDCSGTKDINLAQSRAEATKNFLVEKMRIATERIIATGKPDTIVYECDEDGRWLEDLAKQNRIVKITFLEE